MVIWGVSFMQSGILKDVKNSLRSSSFPCHSAGMVPSSREAASGERLVKVSLSWISPWPQGDAAAARKCSRLNFKRLLSMDVLSSMDAHCMSSVGVVARSSWKL